MLGCSRNLSIYMYPRRKQDGLHLAYLKMRSMYLCMLSVGALIPVKTLGVSVISNASSLVSVFSMVVSRIEDIRDNILGNPGDFLHDEVRPNDR